MDKKEYWIKSVLSNDEDSSDEELVAYFMKEGPMSEEEARQWVAKRKFYLNNIVFNDGSVYNPDVKVKPRVITVTVYLTLRLFAKQDKSFLRETYAEYKFRHVVQGVMTNEAAENLVSDSVIYNHLNEILDKQVMLPELRKKYPDLPDFYIGEARLFTQQVFFEDGEDAA